MIDKQSFYYLFFRFFTIYAISFIYKSYNTVNYSIEKKIDYLCFTLRESNPLEYFKNISDFLLSNLFYK